MNLVKLLDEFQGEIRFDEPLSGHTTFRIGGAVKIWAKPQDLAALRLLVKFAAGSGLPILMVGKGSNLLVSDKPLCAIAVNLSSENFSKIIRKSRDFVVGAGAGLNNLLQASCTAHLGGLEFLAAIPATLGGAIWMNAAAINAGRSVSMADVLKEITVLTAQGEVRDIKKKDFKFSYRKSGLQQCIILQARLGLNLRPESAIRKDIRDNILRRRKLQDLSHPSAGCVFKNPCAKVAGGLAAGYLIEGAGLKGRSVGGARVSARHANFIINSGNAKAADVLKLINLIRKQVKKSFSIELEPEIKFIENNKKFPISKKAKFL